MAKEPKKAKKAIEYYHEIISYLEYYMDIPKNVAEKIIYVEDTLRDLSIEKKIDHRRLAIRLKKRMEIENESKNTKATE